MRIQSFLPAYVTALLAASLFVSASTLTPPVLPLIVRTPYLSAWLGDARAVPWEKWPMFWTGEEIGFSVLASVPETSTVYPLLGRPHDSLAWSGHGKGYNVSFPAYLGTNYDASTTNLTYQIPAPSGNASDKPVEIILSFLSPITPTSTLRQSVPAAYLTIHAEGSFDIDVYVDLNGQWVSGDRGSKIEWSLVQSAYEDLKPLKTWKVRRANEELFTEKRDRAEWGTLHFTGPADARHECGTSAHLRQRFSRTGTLQNEIDDDFRSIMDEEPVFAFSKSFKLQNGTGDSNEGTARDSVMFTIAHLQDEVVQYASARGLTLMRPLWKSWFLSDEALLAYHYLDFRSASLLASNYSAQLALDAYKSGSTSYVDIVALSARQVLGATSFSGTPSNPLLFLKEISSNGNSQTVDVIFPSVPFFLYTNPRWLAYLLEPLMEHQLSGQYPNQYSMHDLGAHFPNETGHADGRDEYMPVEECGNMLIMGLALVHSLKYDSAHAAQSLWSAAGHVDDAGEQLEAETAFPLTISTVDGVSSVDDVWGGGARGARQAKKWLGTTYRLMKQWVSYLVEYSLEPHNQLSTDDFAGWLALQTNLALKGIVGIRAMSEMADTLGIEEDAKYYQNISESYIKHWEQRAMSRDKRYAKLAYNWYGSWTTLYSLYADALLCFHPSITNASSSSTSPSTWSNEEPALVAPRLHDQIPLKPHDPAPNTTHDFIPHKIYTTQSTHYANVLQKFGLPLDSRHLYTKSDWQFEAAAVAEPEVRTEILERVARWVNETSTDRPLSDLWWTEGEGGWPGIYFMARPVVGGHFSFLALGRACGGAVG